MANKTAESYIQGISSLWFWETLFKIVTIYYDLCISLVCIGTGVQLRMKIYGEICDENNFDFLSERSEKNCS